MRDVTGDFEFVKIITSKPESETKDERKHRHKLVAQFFGECLISTYGRKESRKWCAENKGKRFLQRVTPSCRAYTVLLMLDRAEVYEEEHKLVESLSEGDVQLYKQFRRNGRNISKEDKERCVCEAS